MPYECLLTADDLTGTCDAAVHFASRGYRSTAMWEPTDPSPQVIAICTESRNASIPPGLLSRLCAIDARIRFQKIDSTLRGNGGREIQQAMRAFECAAAIVTPAFPAVGRIVEKGYLRVPGDPCFQPIEITAWLRAQGVEGSVSVPENVLCDEDLDRIVAGAMGQKILWAGSGGLAAAIARALPPGPDALPASPPRGRAVTFCIGSDHKVTAAQEQALLEHGIGKGALLRVPRGGISAGDLAGAQALFLCGGDTASLVCRSIGARRIDLAGEVVPGVPWGILREGKFDGMPVATKSGGFGERDTLIRVAEFFA